MLGVIDCFFYCSHAIITYLANKYNKESSFYPMDPEKRARIDLMLHFDSGILYPALRTNDVSISYLNKKIVI